MPSPTVSICIPTFEPSPRFVRELLASIAAQEYEPLEVLIVDDGSTVDPSPVIAEFDDVLAPVVKHNSRNLGIIANWNHAVLLSSGELVMVVGHDDVLVPGMVTSYVAEFVARPDVVLCSSGETFIGEDGRRLERAGGFTQRSRIFRHRHRYELSQADIARLCLRCGQAYGEPSAVMFRRTVFDAIGGYRERYPHALDVDFTLRAAGLGTTVYLAQPYLRRRLHAASATQEQIIDGTALADHVRLIDDYSDLAAFDPRSEALMRATMTDLALRDTLHALRARRWDVAGRNLGVAWRFRPSSPRAVWEHVHEVVTGRNADER